VKNLGPPARRAPCALLAAVEKSPSPTIRKADRAVAFCRVISKEDMGVRELPFRSTASL